MWKPSLEVVSALAGVLIGQVLGVAYIMLSSGARRSRYPRPGDRWINRETGDTVVVHESNNYAVVTATGSRARRGFIKTYKLDKRNK